MSCTTLENEKGEVMGFICGGGWGLGGNETPDYGPVYGFQCVDDPHDFFPDYECNTKQEIENWEAAKTACKCGREMEAQMTDKTNELKCCPFCGGGASIYDEGLEDSCGDPIGEIEYYAGCHNGCVETRKSLNHRATIERWNRRYDHAAAELRWIPVSERLPVDGRYVLELIKPFFGEQTVVKELKAGELCGPNVKACYGPIPSHTVPADNIAEVGEREGV